MGRNKSDRRVRLRILMIAAGAAAGAIAGRKIVKKLRQDEEKKINAIEDAVVAQRDYGDRRVYLVGGGIASLSCAAFLIRDCGFPGENITVLEGRSGRKIKDEILSFKLFRNAAKRVSLIDRDGKLENTERTGLDSCDRIKLLRLFLSKEAGLYGMTVEDYFGKDGHFFNTTIWSLMQACYGIKECCSLVEFRRFIRQRTEEISVMGRSSVKTSAEEHLCENDFVSEDIEKYLEDKGVTVKNGCEVTDIDFAEGDAVTAKCLKIKTVEGEGEIRLKDEDICIVTVGCVTDCTALGDTDTPVGADLGHSMSFELWKRIADKLPGRFGNPEPFFERISDTSVEGFTARLKGDSALKEIINTDLVMLKDSNWGLVSFVSDKDLRKDLSEDEIVISGYGLYPEHIGDYVKKPMKECTGREILFEYLHQLKLDEERISELMDAVTDVIPEYIPYACGAREPRRADDRPLIIPAGSENFAVIGQFVEMPEAATAFEEYSVRSARTAAYKVMNIQRPIAPVTKKSGRAGTLLRALFRFMR